MKEKEKPVLRRMTSMTREEQKEWTKLVCSRGSNGFSLFGMSLDSFKIDKWCEEHGLDNHGLIDKGLAIEAKDE